MSDAEATVRLLFWMAPRLNGKWKTDDMVRIAQTVLTEFKRGDTILLDLRSSEPILTPLPQKTK